MLIASFCKYATFCNLAGVDPSDNHPGVPEIDSIDQTKVIFGDETDVRTEVYPAAGVLIQGKWKLIKGNAGVDKWSGPLYPKVKATSPTESLKFPALFDVEFDAGEHNNLA
eukprot:UC4_evm1s626